MLTVKIQLRKKLVKKIFIFSQIAMLCFALGAVKK